MPLGILEIILREPPHDRQLDRLEQLAPAGSQATHLAAVHPLHGGGNGGVALRQGEESDVAQPAEDVRRSESDPGLNG